MPAHVNLKNKDLSKFSPRAVRCLVWWLGLSREGKNWKCPFLAAPAEIQYSPVFICKSFCFRIFFKSLTDGCPCSVYSTKYVISTVQAIIAAREKEWGK